MKVKCNRCQETHNVILKPKVVKVQDVVFEHDEDLRNPKYTILVKAICPKCERYIKYVKQTDEMMDELNSYFDASLPY